MQREVAFGGAGADLACTITVPRGGAELLPGVVLISFGSGPADRHSDGLFDRLRDHVVGACVAVLAYDKRGAGHPDGCGIRRRLMTWLAMRPPRWRPFSGIRGSPQTGSACWDTAKAGWSRCARPA